MLTLFEYLCPMIALIGFTTTVIMACSAKKKHIEPKHKTIQLPPKPTSPVVEMDRTQDPPTPRPVVLEEAPEGERQPTVNESDFKLRDTNREIRPMEKSSGALPDVEKTQVSVPPTPKVSVELLTQKSESKSERSSKMSPYTVESTQEQGTPSSRN